MVHKRIRTACAGRSYSIMGQAKPHIIKAENADKLAEETLSRFIDSAQNAIRSQGVFRVALSGGQTPAAFYTLLSEKAAWSQIEWDKVHVFWVDERCVPPGDEASNFGLAERTFLRKVPVSDEHIHRMRGENPDAAEAAQDYEQLLKQFFMLQPGQLPQFDLVMLGLGADGHIASLFPGSDALFETKKMVCSVYHAASGLNRITLTAPVIQQAMQIVVLVSGSAKADIVRWLFRPEPDGVKYPVHLLWPVMQKTTWMIDRSAASLIA